MNCLSCGGPLTPGTRFCEQCGTGVAGAVGTPTGGVPPAPTMADPGNAWAPGGPGRPEFPSRPQSGAPTGQGLPEPGSMVTDSPAGGYPGTGAPATSPSGPPAPEKHRGGLWFGIGGGVAAAVIVAIFAIVLLGKSDAEEVSAGGGETSDRVAESGNARSQSAAPATTTQVEATVLGGAWPTAASWAEDRCATKSYAAAMSLETDRSQVAICEDDKDTFYYQGLRKSDQKASPWLKAEYFADQNQFVAVNDSGDPATTYTVTPISLRITTGGVLDSYEFASDSRARGDRSDDDLLRELVSLMEASSDYRGLLRSFTDNTFGGSGCLSADEADRIITKVRDNRAQMVEAGERLQADASGTPIADPAGEFTAAMRASLAVDDLLVAWTSDYWSAHASGGCSGTVMQPDTAYDGEWQRLNNEASSAKERLANKVNPMAEEAGLRHDWTKETI